MHFLYRFILALCFSLQILAKSQAAHYGIEDSAGDQNGVKSSTLSAQHILDKGIAALGGKAKLKSLQGVSTHAFLYRINTLAESAVPGISDVFSSSIGNQTITYDLSGEADNIIQRIDRQYGVGDGYNIFRGIEFQPNDVSLITRGGKNGYSCYIKGNDYIFIPPNALLGYTDFVYANVLLRDATRLSPKLLLAVQASKQADTTLVVRGVSYPSITDPSLNITIAFRPDTFLPYIVRSYEDHQIYGRSENDYILYNYTSIAGVQFPRRIKIVYNDQQIFDTLIDTIDVNPKFPANFFQGLPENQIKSTVFASPPAPAEASSEYGDAEVFEFSQNLLWIGPYRGHLENVTVTYPISGLPGLIHLVFNDAPTYTTTIANMENVVMVTDSPPHQSKLVIEWVRKNLKKKVTHLLLTHHHHDHSYGASDYVAQGAKLVVPNDYAYYWKNIPGVQISPVTAAKPFIHRSNTMQVRAIWPGTQDPHSADWMYFTFTSRCPTATSPLAIVEADVWSPGSVGGRFDQQEARTFLEIARKAKLPRKTLVLPVHGNPTPLTDLFALTGYDYPDFSTADFIPGGPWC